MKIALCQTPDIQNNLPLSLEILRQNAQLAEKAGASMICFPECFLQGYTLCQQDARERALDLSSETFAKLLATLSSVNITLVFGIIELCEKQLHNTAVVVQSGILKGHYRKNHTNESIFTPGTETPVFEVAEYTVGINICYDANFSDGALELESQGADLICYLLNNRLPTDIAHQWRHRHLQNLSQRAQETGCWVVSSDICCQESSQLSFGCSAVVNPDGEKVAQIQELTTGILLCELSATPTFSASPLSGNISHIGVEGPTS